MGRRSGSALFGLGLILGLAGVSSVGSAAPELPIRGGFVTGFDYPVTIEVPAVAPERGVVAPPPSPAPEQSLEPSATPGAAPRPRPAVQPTVQPSLPSRPVPTPEPSS